MATSTVRVHAGTRAALARLSEQRGLNTADLLAEMVERHEQDDLLEQMNAAYARQAEDGAARTAEERERGAWESTLLDGLAEL